MSPNEAVRAVLERHLQSILDNDVAAYHATTVPELTLYEWYVTPHRIDGLAFHDFMLAEPAPATRPGSASTWRATTSRSTGIAPSAPTRCSSLAAPPRAWPSATTTRAA